MLQKILKIVLPALILFLSIGAFVYLRASRPEQPVAQIDERIWRVEVVTLVPARLAPSLTLYGQLETAELFRAAAPAASRVDRVLVREGERVLQGQLLVALDERDFLPRLQQAKAEVAELEAQLQSEAIRQQSDRQALKHEQRLLELSQQGVERVSKLQRQKMGSDSALDEARQALARQALSLTSREQSIADHPSRRQALEARLQQASARLEEARLDLERSQIHAPYDGILARVEVAEGSRVKANDPLLSLYDPETLELRGRIPAPYLQELQRTLASGQSLSGRITLGDGDVTLRLARLAGEARPSGIDALFRIESGRKGDLRAGQMLRFHLERSLKDSAVPVPFSAVYGGDRVYTLKGGRMRRHAIETLGSFLDDDGQERLLVRSATLKRGDSLVLTHLPNAVDGLRAEAVAEE